MSTISNRLERMAAERGISPLETLEFYLERAAIREYDDGMSRNDAETAALADVEQWLTSKGTR